MYQRIKELCKSNKISVTKLEHELGFAKGYLYKLNTTSPSVDKVKKIADFFNVDINVLL